MSYVGNARVGIVQVGYVFHKDCALTGLRS